MMSLGWQDAVVGVIALAAFVFLYRHFRPRRRDVVTVIPTNALRVRDPRPKAPDGNRPR